MLVLNRSAESEMCTELSAKWHAEIEEDTQGMSKWESVTKVWIV